MFLDKFEQFVLFITESLCIPLHNTCINHIFVLGLDAFAGARWDLWEWSLSICEALDELLLSEDVLLFCDEVRR